MSNTENIIKSDSTIVEEFSQDDEKISLEQIFDRKINAYNNEIDDVMEEIPIYDKAKLIKVKLEIDGYNYLSYFKNKVYLFIINKEINLIVNVINFNDDEMIIFDGQNKYIGKYIGNSQRNDVIDIENYTLYEIYVRVNNMTDEEFKKFSKDYNNYDYITKLNGYTLLEKMCKKQNESLPFSPIIRRKHKYNVLYFQILLKQYIIYGQMSGTLNKLNTKFSLQRMQDIMNNINKDQRSEISKLVGSSISYIEQNNINVDILALAKFCY